MKRLVITATTLFVLVLSVLPQPRPSSASDATSTRTGPSSSTWSEQVEERLQLAVSSIDYPVTPGDIYQLSFREPSGSIVTRQFQVDGLSILDMGVFGKINASNMTFYELKRNIEEMIRKNYTYSTPSLSIVSPGVFRVSVREGTARVQYVTAWGLSRLSEVVASVDMPNASIRDVERISRDGMSEHFDLLKASSAPVEGGDPFVRPGDTIVLHQAVRTIELRGEVQRPGRFELLENEDLKELIDLFGKGFTNKADHERIRVIRSSGGTGRIEIVSFEKAREATMGLADGDIVIVENKTSKLAQVWFVGAVVTRAQERDVVPSAGIQGGGAGSASGAGKFFHTIGEGTMLSDVLQEVRFSILPSADTSSALVKKPRSGSGQVVDLKHLLDGLDLSGDIELVPDTVIFIPELRPTVSVAGAVINPGSFTYFPGAPAEYYISLSGGFNPEQNRGGSFNVYNQYGKKRHGDQGVMPGDNIFVKSNAWGYKMERAIPVLIPIAALVVSTLTLYYEYLDNNP